MSDRTLNWGESEAAARYQTGDDDPDGGDFIVAKNTDNETVLLEWDNTDEQWVFAGDVDMGGNDVTNAGVVSAVDGSFDALEADKADTRSGYTDVTTSRSLDTTETNTTGSDLDVSVTTQSQVDNTNMAIDLVIDGSEISRSVQNQSLADDTVTVTGTVANGSDYSVESLGDTADYTLRSWSEQQ